MFSSCSAEETEIEGRSPPADSARLKASHPEHGARRLSTASSLATVESIPETTLSMESLSIVSSVSSYGSSMQLPQDATQHVALEDVSEVSKHPSTDPQKIAGSLYSLRRRAAPNISQNTLEVRKACRYDCNCKCHESDAIKPHGGLLRFKSSKARCTDPMCWSTSAAEITYAKQSVSFRNALFQVIPSKSIKLRYNLNTYRMVPEGSDAMRYIKHGNLKKLQSCIQCGEATIWDTAPDGWSLLHVSEASQVSRGVD